MENALACKLLAEQIRDSCCGSVDVANLEWAGRGPGKALESLTPGKIKTTVMGLEPLVLTPPDGMCKTYCGKEMVAYLLAGQALHSTLQYSFKYLTHDTAGMRVVCVCVCVHKILRFVDTNFSRLWIWQV